MFVAFDFDLNAVAVGAVVPKASLCEPNSPIMSNSCRREWSETDVQRDLADLSANSALF
jgi:hypothetical protein